MIKCDMDGGRGELEMFFGQDNNDVNNSSYILYVLKG